jgi:hypothetical protein
MKIRERIRDVGLKEKMIAKKGIMTILIARKLISHFYYKYMMLKEYKREMD